ncbi:MULTISPECIES: peptide chain release factor 2 [unclassified Gemella]|uniref:peptide chain release factor 2 n=1 Tax=unclassified Gemella TaxID=2624949 RepID=UPI0010746A18|nr:MULTISPECIES: peptide chain release factor 2 [unclassified Gemella]MBF0710731.1 peptide chain release factor 2 [Gemella sp. GL1.1]MBF0746700.1 peptide chain release factor 2 [Gemella sp. 19428wG2_WT2a]NYS28075.1 peptide chain release factor 2 [Gemella sp. GL1]TFU60049.1 peptide chain release factor 2 [Gemella sp. WT2a]
MELVEIRRELADIKKKIEDFSKSLKLDVKEERLANIENQMLNSDFWNDNEVATKLVAESKFLKNELDEFADLSLLLEHNEEIVDYLKDQEDLDIYEELLENQKKLTEKMDKFTMRLLLSEDYDNHSAIFEIHAGAGGVDSADCAEILLRMYERFFQKQGLKYSFQDYQAGDVCGVKSVTIKVEGDFAYGLLKGEKGVHRFVRISPFDSSGKRHTSFCSVDIVPEFEDTEIDIQISPDEIKVDTYRASGAGGQHINTTDSAVRISHIPSGIVVQSQAERSQISNRETAMKELKSKLYQLKLDEKAKELSSIRGEQMTIAWGSQIKSYVFAPYTMVKDHRTGFEVSTIDKVLDGQIFDFIEAYLHFNMNMKIKE